MLVYIGYSGIHPLRDRKQELHQKEIREQISDEIQMVYSRVVKDAKSEEEPENEEHGKKDTFHKM